MKKMLTICLTLLGATVLWWHSLSAELPPPPPGIETVIPGDVPGYAAPRSTYVVPFYPRLSGRGFSPGDTPNEVLLSPPDVPPPMWFLDGWVRGVTGGPHRTLTFWAERWTDPRVPYGLYPYWMTPPVWTPWVQSSFSGAWIGERCRTRINDRVDRANIIFQRGNWLAFVWTAYMRPAERGVLTWEDVFFLEALAMEMDARIVSWELWGKVNLAPGRMMLPAVEIVDNQAKPTEELAERQIWLPISPPETEPIVTPVDFLVQKLGGGWKWDEEKKEGEATLADRTIHLTAGSTEVVMNDETLHFDQAPQLASPTLTIPLDMARTLFKGLIEIQDPQPNPTTTPEDNQ